MYKQHDIAGGYTLTNDGNLPRLTSQPNRPTGIHLSGILSKIHGYSNKISPETLETQHSFLTSNLMELGCMFEFALKHWLKVSQPNRYIDPPSLLKDGIHLTPDLYYLGDDYDAYGEVKLTRKSANACPGDDRFAYWESQLKSYCHADNCNTGRLMICHVNGFYRWLSRSATLEEIANDDVVFNIWERTYSDQELISNWAMILAQKG